VVILEAARQAADNQSAACILLTQCCRRFEPRESMETGLDCPWQGGGISLYGIRHVEMASHAFCASKELSR
jgi:hypothetical protein